MLCGPDDDHKNAAYAVVLIQEIVIHTVIYTGRSWRMGELAAIAAPHRGLFGCAVDEDVASVETKAAAPAGGQRGSCATSHSPMGRSSRPLAAPTPPPPRHP
jgi:hypothetical protein